MSKAFVKESDTELEEEPLTTALPQGLRNYVTPSGYARMKAELKQLFDAKQLGRKTGIGIFDYSGEKPVLNAAIKLGCDGIWFCRAS